MNLAISTPKFVTYVINIDVIIVSYEFLNVICSIINERDDAITIAYSIQRGVHTQFL